MIHFQTKNMKLSLQDFTVSPMEIFRRDKSIGILRNTSVGFLFVGNTIVRRYIGQKNKKNICWWFYRWKLRAKKKVSRLKYTDGFIPSVIVWLTDGVIPSVNLSMSVWNTDQKYLSVNSSVIVAGTVKYRRIKSKNKVVGEAVIPTEYIRL